MYLHVSTIFNPLKCSKSKYCYCSLFIRQLERMWMFLKKSRYIMEKLSCQGRSPFKSTNQQTLLLIYSSPQAQQVITLCKMVREVAEGVCCSGAKGPGYAMPLDAMARPRESLIYVTCVYSGTRREKPNYLATMDVDPSSASIFLQFDMLFHGPIFL